MTEADAVDPDSEDEPERKDSLDVHEEGLYRISMAIKRKIM